MSELSPNSGPSRVAVSIDLDAPGKAFGHLAVPHSRDESAWGSVRVPLVRIARGDGPTVLLTGGNHGDEYEGQIALANLARALQPDDIHGRVFVLPALNLPAVRAGRRTSPIDGGNMNRAFPGDARGGVTAMIADCVYRELVARADVVVDIHSGGRTLMFAPAAIAHRFDDPARMRATLALLRAFAAPYALLLTELDCEGLLDTAVEDLGKLFLSTELGGGGTATPETVAIATRGVRGVLRHLGMLVADTDNDVTVTTAADAAAGTGAAGAPPTRILGTAHDGAFVTSDHDGVIEFLVPLAAELRRGDAIARIHDYQRPDTSPHEYRAACAGVLICRHFPGLVGIGDCLAVIADDYRDN